MRGRKSKRIAKKAAGAPGTAVGPVAGQSAVPAAGDRVAWLTVIGARQNNLRGITVDVPLRRFVCVTGVSGSGKSSLVNDIILKALARDLNGAVKVDPGDHDRIDGLEHLDKVIDIDQSPIGRTPRSNPATYVKVFDEIRALYAKLPDSKVRGYKPGRFSFNVGTGRAGGGRCEACEGNGSNKMEMDFLADVWVTCPVCNGRRFSRETLQILYKGRSIADVLDLDVQEALEHFCNVPKIARMLRTLHEVGLDYIKLGQSSTTLSGGEAQRIKLARELVKKSTGATLYLLDEPTTGLHFADIKRLLSVLHGFVDAGNTVIVIEHNLDVIKTADWVIDLGPEGGAGGGRVVAAGTPEMVARSKRSYTGAALRGVLGTRRFGARANERNRAGKRSDGRSGTTKKRPRPRRDAVTVVGAKQHNLKDITVQVPRGKMTVCCGPSGSGKSSLAVDTIYTEGQRRYVESLSAYARQFLSRLRPPHVDHVYGLSPAVCIEQKTASKSPRSTVGTVTEIYDYLRVLWSRAGQPYCPACKIPIGTQTSDEIVERVLALGEGRRILVLAQVHPAGAEHYDQLFKRERANGYARVRVDGTVYSLDQPIEIDRRRSHRIELVVDRIVVRKSRRSRLSDSVEQALALGGGAMTVLADFEEPEKRAIAPSTALGPSVSGGEEYRFSRHRSCGRCGQSYEELAPHHFSFNTRMGWCDACEGLGTQQGANPAAIVVHPTRSIAAGAIAGWGTLRAGSKLHAFATALADHLGFALDTPWNDLEDTQQLAFLHGCGDEWIDVNADPERAPGENRGTPAGASGSACDAGGTVAQAEACGSRCRELSGLRFQWHGFFPAISRAARSSWQYRKRLEELTTDVPCNACKGGRLRPDAAAVKVGDATLHEVCLWPLGRTLDWFAGLKLSAHERKIAGELLKEITSRLRFLVEVGVEYLSLHRTASTLSGGESQRIQLASQIGTGLSGVLYVLDEPTIGLHPRDNDRLIRALKRLRALGNTLLLVEHDREVIDSADHVLDFGPGAGVRGGQITAAGAPKTLRRRRASLTGSYLSGRKSIAVPSNRRPVPCTSPGTDIAQARVDHRARLGGAAPGTKRLRGVLRRVAGTPGRDDGCAFTNGRSALPLNSVSAGDLRWLIVHGAREHNLKEVDVAFPLGRFTCVTGVSGSGKSTLVTTILYNALASRLHRARLVPGGYDRMTGMDHIDKVINVDQSPIGNSPMSNPATYTGVFDVIRELYAKLPLSKVRGYSASRFSFNRPGGRCEACQGMGQRCIEMHFLPDVWVECEECKGQRYVAETLDVQYRGKSIADVLSMTVSEGVDLLGNVPKIRRMLQTLDDVGLGYLQLGQAAPTLSAGEAQRVKLAAELGRPSTGKTLYILDEPTTGLHFQDLKKLLDVLHRLVDLGNTCICIEHNLDVIKTADWVIDLGPEAGDAGGMIVAEGTPEHVARSANSHTSAALAAVLAAGPCEKRAVYDHTQQASLDVELASPIDVASDVKMPWERDGRAWHTVNHVDHRGAPTEWDAKLLVWLADTVVRLGPFAPADWNHRTRIEITAGANRPWFCHILTGGKDLLEVAFRVQGGTFNSVALRKKLDVKDLDDRPDLAIYGQWSRVRVRTPNLGWQEVRLFLRDFKDIKKVEFRAFLRRAAKAYFQQLGLAEAYPRKVEPWKTQGQSWHLSQKSINARHVTRWKPALLLAMVGRLKAMQPDLNVAWDSKTAARFTVPGEDKPAGKIVTNLGRGLRIELRAPHGSVTPTQIDRLGEEPEIKRRPGCDYITFWVRSLAQSDPSQLRDIWRLCHPIATAEGVAGNETAAERLQLT